MILSITGLPKSAFHGLHVHFFHQIDDSFHGMSKNKVMLDHFVSIFHKVMLSWKWCQSILWCHSMEWGHPKSGVSPQNGENRDQKDADFYVTTDLNLAVQQQRQVKKRREWEKRRPAAPAKTKRLREKKSSFSRLSEWRNGEKQLKNWNKL